MYLVLKQSFSKKCLDLFMKTFIFDFKSDVKIKDTICYQKFQYKNQIISFLESQFNDS